MVQLDRSTSEVRPSPAIDLRSDVLSPPTRAMFDAMAAAEIGWTLQLGGPVGRPPRTARGNDARDRGSPLRPERDDREPARTARRGATRDGGPAWTHRAHQRRRVVRAVDGRAVGEDRRLGPRPSRRGRGRGRLRGGRWRSGGTRSASWSWRTRTRSPVASRSRLTRPAPRRASRTRTGRLSTSTGRACGMPRWRSGAAPAALTPRSTRPLSASARGFVRRTAGCWPGERLSSSARGRSRSRSGSGGSTRRAISRPRASSRSRPWSTGLPTTIAGRAGSARLSPDVGGLTVDLETVQTNIVNARLGERLGDPAQVVARLRDHGVGMMAMPGGYLRAVVHRGVGDDDIEAAIDTIPSALA